MSYTVLARRYRSTSFGQVVGQEPIARTLTNAIAGGRVAHAYLFTGTRGVGKTSMARILARALNAPATVQDCPPPQPSESDAYPAEDVQQRMAEAIMRGDDLNVIEIDGASNRGVEEARQLISNASLAPTGNARYKVYIIDEVHMLTREAFNALLKTMEEPPAHVKFILCTTEAHKVPATISSRCQRFDFRNIATGRIAEHLANVLEKENVKADQQLLWQVARLGNGSMRDALSLLDRLIASAGDEDLSTQILEQMLGLPPQQRVVELVDALAAGDVAGSLEHSAAIMNTGISQDQLVDVLIDRLRQLMLIRACGQESELVELADEARKDAARQAESFDTSGLVYMIALCENLQRNARASSQPRALLEVTVVRLALAEKMADVTDLLQGNVPAKKKLGQVAPKAERPRAAPQSAQPVRAAEPNEPVSGAPAPSAPPVTEQEPGQADDLSGDSGAPGQSKSGVSDPQDVWATVLQQVEGRNALTWIRSLELDRIEKGMAHLVVRAGGKQMTRFVTEARRDKLAEMIESVTGQRVKVSVHAGEDGEQTQASSPGQSRKDQRDQAMDLPLVKDVMDTFDATVTRVKSAEPQDSQDQTP